TGSRHVLRGGGQVGDHRLEAVLHGTHFGAGGVDVGQRLVDDFQHSLRTFEGIDIEVFGEAGGNAGHGSPVSTAFRQATIRQRSAHNKRRSRLDRLQGGGAGTDFTSGRAGEIELIVNRLSNQSAELGLGRVDFGVDLGNRD